MGLWLGAAIAVGGGGSVVFLVLSVVLGGLLGLHAFQFVVVFLHVFTRFNLQR
jgi:hypothetical protein